MCCGTMKTLCCRYSRIWDNDKRTHLKPYAFRNPSVESFPNMRYKHCPSGVCTVPRCSEAIRQEYSSGSASIYTRKPPGSSDVRVVGPLKKSSTVALVAGERGVATLFGQQGQPPKILYFSCAGFIMRREHIINQPEVIR